MAKKGNKKFAKYTTASGLEVQVNSVPVFLIDEATQVVEFPKKPTYITTTVGGEEEEHFHDSTTLETEEDFKAWDEYTRKMEELSKEQNSRMMKVLMLKGVDIDLNSDDFSDWLDEMEFLEIPVPDNKMARKVKYVETRVMGNTEDLVNILELIMQLSGVPEEAVARAVGSFQRAIQKATAGVVTAQ